MDVYFLVRAAFALIFVLSLIGALAWIARRFGLLQQTRPGRQLQVVESCPLDARHRLVLFRCGEHHHMALIGPNSCQLLNEAVEVSAHPAAEAPEPPGNVIGWPARLQALS